MPTFTDHIYVRVGADLKAWVKAEAARRETTDAEYVRQLLQAERDRPHGRHARTEDHT